MKERLKHNNITLNDTIPFEKYPQGAIEQLKVSDETYNPSLLIGHVDRHRSIQAFTWNQMILSLAHIPNIYSFAGMFF